MSPLNNVLALSTLVATAIGHPWPHHKNRFSWDDTRHLIAFGDSYTYVQGTHGHQNYSFIGDALNLAYTPQELLSNRIVQNQTATAEGGPNWVEFITQCGLEPGLTNPRDCEKQLWDFAYAGSDISTEYLPLHHNHTVSFVNQTRQFATYADPVLSRFVDKSKSLVAVWMGINDINDSDTMDVDFPSFYDRLHAALFDALAANVYSKGYKNYLFLKLPPINRSPANQLDDGGQRPNATMVEWFNEALASHARRFERKHWDANVMVYDTTSFLTHVLDCPDDYGIANTTGYCAAYNQPYVDTDPEMYGCRPLNEYL